MSTTMKIAWRNVLRYRRRSLLTLLLIALGVTFVMVFISFTGSFKDMITRQITDSMLGHIQIHRRGYLGAIDALPLTMNLRENALFRITDELDKMPEVESYSVRLKFGAMFSNFTETSSIRLSGVIPDGEFSTVPLLLDRVKKGSKEMLPGTVMIPELLANGMGVKVGDTIVLVATNKEGSVNGRQFTVGAILESATGPGGRDGYIHIDDARSLLRMEEFEISEIAIRLTDFGKLDEITDAMDKAFTDVMGLNPMGMSMVDVKSWKNLSPFANIVKIIDVMSIFIKVMLVAIVVISIMNVMLMSVYERIREIGTIAAIGTLPATILNIFLMEGVLLGIIGSGVGALLGGIIVTSAGAMGVPFSFGRNQNLILHPAVNPADTITIILVVILFAVLATLFPARKAARLEPVEALRHV